MNRLISILLILVINNSLVRAETVEFSEDELASESVLPVFDKTEAVKQREVVTEGHFDVGIHGGINMNEAFYSAQTYGISGTYHFDEINAVNINYYIRQQSLSSYGQQLKSGEGLTGATFDPSLAPFPSSLLLANYQYTAYYGKISLTKQATMNLALYGILGVGTVNYGDVTPFTFNVGFGQKFYFTKKLALQLDLLMIYYQGNNPTDTTQNMTTGSGSKPSSAFGDRAYFDPFFMFGGVFLL